MYSEQGSWNLSTQIKAYGPSCRYTFLRNIGDWAQFKFYPERQGQYDVFEIVPRTTNISNEVVYKIIVDDQPVDSVHINQNESSGDWVKIGRYHFPAGAEVRTKVINTGSATEGHILFADAIKFYYLEDVTYVQEIDSQTPDEYFLSQNYPNPFNSSTTIRFGLKKADRVILKLYNLLSQEVVVILDSHLEAGNHQVEFDASKLSSGIYFYQIMMGNFSYIKKMVLLR